MTNDVTKSNITPLPMQDSQNFPFIYFTFINTHIFPTFLFINSH